MGALSSWPMLALTHHVIVQIASWRAGFRTWFKGYAVLGDDIVIADKAVANCYLVLMADLGVDINLSKSVESEIGVAEFAKRLFGPQGDYSPLSPKLVSSIISDWRNLPTVIRDMMSRGLLVNPYKLFFGPKDPKAMRRKVPTNILWDIIGPLGFLRSEVGLTPFLGVSSLTSTQKARFLEVVDEFVSLKQLNDYYKSLVALQDLRADFVTRRKDSKAWLSSKIPEPLQVL